MMNKGREGERRMIPRRIKRKAGLGKAYLVSTLIFLGSIVVGLVAGVLVESLLLIIAIIVTGSIVANVIFWKRLRQKIEDRR